MFFDDETTKFKLKFIGRENITTKFELYLQWSLDLSSRASSFLKNKSLTVWVSDDDNRLPIRIKADVGSIKQI
jgi:hypothetical protein